MNLKEKLMRLQLVIFLQKTPPAISIWDSNQPPKTSPEGFVSAGIATALIEGTLFNKLLIESYI